MIFHFVNHTNGREHGRDASLNMILTLATSSNDDGVL